jgi:hypothetical protein
LLKTENAEQSTNLTIERFNELPLYAAAGGASLRYPWAMTNIMPGASIVPNGGNTNIRVNGLQNDTFQTKIDGQDATFTQQQTFSSGSQPSVEALEEVSLQTSNFAAEYGQVGGGLFNFTSKSGTNKLHGSGFEYFRNEDLNAGQPFTSSGNGHLLRRWPAATITVLLWEDRSLFRTSTTVGTGPFSSLAWSSLTRAP